MTDEEENKNKLEKLAELEHEQWVEWSQEIAKKETLSQERLDRWKKLWVPYKDLTELEKESDRMWARRVADKMKRKRKFDIYFFITLFGLLLILFMIAYGGYYIGKNQSKQTTYQMCRSFNFMAYLNTETIRHYQNSSFEISQMPNCKIYLDNYIGKVSMTYQEWLTENNLEHINWTTTNETKGGNEDE